MKTIRKFNNSKVSKGNLYKFIIDWNKTKGKKNKKTDKMEVLPIKYFIRSFTPGKLQKGEKYITVEKRKFGGKIEFVKQKVKIVTKPGKIYYKRISLMVGEPS